MCKPRLTPAALCLLFAALPSHHAPGQSPHPHIVFILADDMGYGDPGCYNPESKAPTPNIDGLARAGMRFTDAHAPASLCVPTRYGLMTGRYPFRGNFSARTLIPPGQLTIATLLRRNGYRTAMVGKWHLGFDVGPNPDWSQPMRGGPVDHGFDTYFGIPASLDIPPYYYIRDRRPVAPPSEHVESSNSEGWTKIQGAFWRKGGIAPGFRHEDVLPRIGEEAVKTIDTHAKEHPDRPLFLYVALTAPHTPWLPLERFRGKSNAGMYGDFVMQVDDTVGQVLSALDRNRLSENTLVFFTSDNGPVWYEQDVNRLGHRSTGPLRGMKADAWEGGHRVPFVARWPGRVPPGTQCDQTICFTDMLATFAALVGDTLPPDAKVDSFNMLPLLERTRPHQPIRDVTIHKQSATAIRQGKWKLITHLGSGGFSQPRRQQPLPDGPQGQLYDLDQDIGETNNLWLDRPEVVRQLTDLLRQCREN